MRRLADGRIRRSAEEWERIFDRFDSSDLTATAFCRREKIAKGSFEKWKKKVSRRSKAATAGPTFVEWPSPAEPASDRSIIAPRLSSGELELSLPGGVVIRWKL
jgi:hypothetical protein